MGANMLAKTARVPMAYYSVVGTPRQSLGLGEERDWHPSVRSSVRANQPVKGSTQPMTDDPLSQFGLEAIDLRWTLKDIMAKRWTLTPVNQDHVNRLIDLGLVEMRDDQPFVTVKGQDLAWVAD